MKKYNIILSVLIIFLVTSCTANTTNIELSSAISTAGFWLGLWHGFIAPITFLISLFYDTVTIYEIFNNGNWYNFGFMIGITSSVGGSARTT